MPIGSGRNTHELRSLVSPEAWRVYLGIEELWTERLDLRLTLAQPRGSRR
jgi:hypothetical protein